MYGITLSTDCVHASSVNMFNNIISVLEQVNTTLQNQNRQVCSKGGYT